MSLAMQTAIKTGLRKWVEYAVAGLAGVTVIHANQGKSRPERPYADIRIDSIQPKGRDEIRETNGSGTRHVIGQRVVIATIQAYGPSALGLAEQIRSYLWFDATQDLLRQSGLAFLTADPVQNITTSIETSIEERGAFVARFGLAYDRTEQVGWIDDVEVSATYQDPAGDTEYEDEFWVPESPA